MPPTRGRHSSIWAIYLLQLQTKPHIQFDTFSKLRGFVALHKQPKSHWFDRFV